jgi:hypothetical protein
LELVIVYAPVILQDPYNNIIDFASSGWLAAFQNPFWREILYVGLLLIPRKKTEFHKTKHNLPQQAAG